MAVTINEKDLIGTLDDLCLWCAISRNTAQDYADKGVFVAVSPGKYRLVKSTNNYIERLRKAASGRGGPIETARAKLIEAQTKLAEKKAGALSGELVPIKEVEVYWASVLKACSRGGACDPVEDRRPHPRRRASDRRCDGPGNQGCFERIGG